MDSDYDPETQLCSLTKSEDSVDCRTWNSRGRRLFPQRRPSIPTSASRCATAIRGFSHFESSPSRDHSPIDHYDSNTSSPSSVDSVGTVKVRVSPTLDWPFPEADPQVGEDARGRTPWLVGSLPQSCSVERPLTPRNSSIRSCETSFSAPLYNSTPARGNLRWKSMAQFHRNGRRLRPRTPLQLENREETPDHSDDNEDELVPATHAFRGDLPFEVVPCQRSQSPETIAHSGLVPIEVHQDWGPQDDTYVVTKDQSRPDIPPLELAPWDCTVKLSTVTTVTDNGRLHIHHLALLSVIMPMKKLYAEQVSLSFVVANALRNDQKRSLGPGQTSLLFEEDVSKPGFFPCEGAELVIVRDSCDLEKPLSLYFNFTYSSPCHFVMASLPTFRPKEGRSLSEVVFIAEPMPPLSMRTLIRDPLSSWKLCHHRVSQVICYERIDLPRLYPAGFQDDIQMRILELAPVQFRALGESTLSSVVWNLDITVHQHPGEQVECQMSFFLEAGAVAALVSLDPHGWVPRYFIVDGRVATKKVGECWTNKEGHITIFKQTQMALGPIMVQTYWQGPPKHDKDGAYSADNPLIPRVADRKVLGGRLTCGGNERFVLLNHLAERICTHGPVDGTYTLLPTLDAGYMIRLKHVPEARSPKPRRDVLLSPTFLPVPADTQLLEHTVLHSDAEIRMDHERGWNHTANNVKGKAVSPKHMLEAILLPLLVLLLLVPGFLLFIGHVRKGNNPSERAIWRDQDPSAMSRDEKRPEAIMDVAALDPWQPVVASEKHGNKAEKCDGWRDRIDVYVGGWKGCTI